MLSIGDKYRGVSGAVVQARRLLLYPRMSFWITALLLTLSLAPISWGVAAWGFPEPWPSSLAAPALIGLAATACARWLWGRPGRDPRAFTVWSLCLTWTWWSFWMEDLHRAGFRAVLLLVPLGVAGVALTRRAFARPGPWRQSAVAGVCLGLGLVWSLSMDRLEGAGCAGVSAIYEGTLAVTWLALFLMGPWVAEMCRAPAPALPWLPAPDGSPETAPRSGRTAPSARGDG